MAGFDYSTEAELFPTRIRKYRRQAFGYKRLAQAADFIRFAIEQLPDDFALGAYLEVGKERFDTEEFVTCNKIRTTPSSVTRRNPPP